jgi:hypothetical protein
VFGSGWMFHAIPDIENSRSLDSQSYRSKTICLRCQP